MYIYINVLDIDWYIDIYRYHIYRCTNIQIYLERCIYPFIFLTPITILLLNTSNYYWPSYQRLLSSRQAGRAADSMGMGGGGGGWVGIWSFLFFFLPWPLFPFLTLGLVLSLLPFSFPRFATLIGALSPNRTVHTVQVMEGRKGGRKGGREEGTGSEGGWG